MKRLLSVLLLCHITISFLWAQPVHQVKGTVIDKSSRQPLEFINVMIVGLNRHYPRIYSIDQRSAHTDRNGREPDGA